MNALWTRKNRPLLVSLMQEVIMVAADVDNDISKSGETVSQGDGKGLANPPTVLPLSTRVATMSSERPPGLKHFGKRRLGRAGLDDTDPVPDNVWDVDCSDLIDPSVNGVAVHGEHFNPAETKV
jgi:hypothetical protein